MDITKTLALYGSVVATAGLVWSIYQFYDKKGRIRIAATFKLKENKLLGIKHYHFSIINLTERKLFIEYLWLHKRKKDVYDSLKYKRLRRLPFVVKFLRKKKFKLFDLMTMNRLNESIITLFPSEPLIIDIPVDYLNAAIPDKFRNDVIFLSLIISDILHRKYSSGEIRFITFTEEDYENGKHFLTELFK